MTTFRFPGGDARTTVMGATGSGKTRAAAWLLAHQSFIRPWVILDFKREALFDLIGFPPIQPIDYDTVPKQPGLYLLAPKPGDEDVMEAWLWRVWRKGNIGLYIDEGANVPNKAAMSAILRQGRSLRIPVIVGVQRPVDVPREYFSEVSFLCMFRLQDRRDYKTVQGFAPFDEAPMPPYHWQWYDVARDVLLRMGPVPDDATIVRDMRAKVPYTPKPFRWIVPKQARTR